MSDWWTGDRDETESNRPSNPQVDCASYTDLANEAERLRKALARAEAVIHKIALGHGASDHACTWQSLCRDYRPADENHSDST